MRGQLSVKNIWLDRKALNYFCPPMSIFNGDSAQKVCRLINCYILPRISMFALETVSANIDRTSVNDDLRFLHNLLSSRYLLPFSIEVCRKSVTIRRQNTTPKNTKFSIVLFGDECNVGRISRSKPRDRDIRKLLRYWCRGAGEAQKVRTAPGRAKTRRLLSIFLVPYCRGCSHISG